MSIDIGSYIEKWALEGNSQSNPDKPANRCEISWDRINYTGDFYWTIVENKRMHHALYSGTFSNKTTTATADHTIKLDTATGFRSNVSFTRGMTNNLPKLLTTDVPEKITGCIKNFGPSNIELDTSARPLAQSEKVKVTVDTKLTNQSGTGLEATVKMNEHILAGTFEGKAFLKGTIVVSLYNDDTYITCTQDDICNIPFYTEHKELRMNKEKKTLDWDVKGSFRFIFGMQHEFHLDTMKNANEQTAASAIVQEKI